MVEDTALKMDNGLTCCLRAGVRDPLHLTGSPFSVVLLSILHSMFYVGSNSLINQNITPCHAIVRRLTSHVHSNIWESRQAPSV